MVVEFSHTGEIRGPLSLAHSEGLAATGLPQAQAITEAHAVLDRLEERPKTTGARTSGRGCTTIPRAQAIQLSAAAMPAADSWYHKISLSILVTSKRRCRFWGTPRSRGRRPQFCKPTGARTTLSPPASPPSPRRLATHSLYSRHSRHAVNSQKTIWRRR